MTRRRDGIGPDLVGRRLLVTGGGTGIGAATARLAAEAGMKVMVGAKLKGALSIRNGKNMH